VPPDAEERLRITNSWANEANTLRKMNKSHSEHILRFITAFTLSDTNYDRSYFLIFEWADGGSLNDLYANTPAPTLTPELVKRTATQLLGLAEALKATHDAVIRHGDIKPDNILHFKPANKHDIIGTLKIGDWGLAKYHPDSTVLRLKKGQPTDTRFGTTAYEPPEVELAKLKLLSRQYDIWSTGCVVLEMIIWLVYGYIGIKNFRLDVQGGYRESVPFYTIEKQEELEDGKTIHRAKLQKPVEDWLDHLEGSPVCDPNTALGELLRVVRRQLLIVELPPDMGQTVYVKNWDSEDDPSKGAFKMLVREPTVNDPVIRESKRIVTTQRHRATSAALVAALGTENGIMDPDLDNNDYWLKPGAKAGKAPRLYKNTPRAMQDEFGQLTPKANSPKSPRLLPRIEEASRPDANLLSTKPHTIVRSFLVMLFHHALSLSHKLTYCCNFHR
jgi:serine/threonine protein kinase